MKIDEIEVANPGSKDAVNFGCTCPSMDNAHGLGVGTDEKTGDTLFWISGDCPLHVTKEDVRVLYQSG